MERICGKIGFELKVKAWGGVVDDRSGESTEEGNVTGIERGKSASERLFLAGGEKPRVDFRDAVKHIVRNDR